MICTYRKAYESLSLAALSKQPPEFSDHQGEQVS